MTTKFKAIASAVTAAAIAATVSATSLATSPNETDLTAIPAEPENLSSETVKTEYGSLAETLTPFELAAIMGEPIEAPDGRTYPIGHSTEEQADTDSLDMTGIALTKNTNITGHNHWVGNFVATLSGFSATFTEPETFECYVDSGDSYASMTAKIGYLGNYKQVKISTTYLLHDTNGKEKYEYDVQTCNSNESFVPVNGEYTGTGKPVEMMFFFSLRSGTESAATLMDYVVVHLVDPSYAKTAQFAAEPYSGLIDTYTYIPAEMCQ